MSKQFNIQIRLLLTASLVQIAGTIAVEAWESFRIQSLRELGMGFTHDLASRWLLGVDLFLIAAAVIVCLSKRVTGIAFVLLFLSILCQIPVYYLGFSARTELLSDFDTGVGIDGLIASGSLSASSIPWFSHSGWQWWFWVWITTCITFIIFNWELLRFLRTKVSSQRSV